MNIPGQGHFSHVTVVDTRMRNQGVSNLTKGFSRHRRNFCRFFPDISGARDRGQSSKTYKGWAPGTTVAGIVGLVIVAGGNKLLLAELLLVPSSGVQTPFCAVGWPRAAMPGSKADKTVKLRQVAFLNNIAVCIKFTGSEMINAKGYVPTGAAFNLFMPGNVHRPGRKRPQAQVGTPLTSPAKIAWAWSSRSLVNFTPTALIFSSI